MTLDTAAVEVATRLQAWLDASVADFKLGVPVVMPSKKPATPPWISKSRVNRAGEAPPQMRLDFGVSRNDEILGSMRAMRRAHLK